MKAKLKKLLKELPMCYGTFKDYREYNNITHEDYMYLIKYPLIVASHGYYYKVTEATK